MKRRGSLLLGLAVVSILMIILSAVAPNTGTIITSVNDNNLKDQCYLLDNALSSWFTSHGGQYPDSLLILQNMGFVSKQMSLDNFTYSLSADQTLYRVTITLKNGSTYTSVGSKL